MKRLALGLAIVATMCLALIQVAIRQDARLDALQEELRSFQGTVAEEIRRRSVSQPQPYLRVRQDSD